jgi:hypothetical protein
MTREDLEAEAKRYVARVRARSEANRPYTDAEAIEDITELLAGAYSDGLKAGSNAEIRIKGA